MSKEKQNGRSGRGVGQEIDLGNLTSRPWRGLHVIVNMVGSWSLGARVLGLYSCRALSSPCLGYQQKIIDLFILKVFLNFFAVTVF